MRMFFSGMTAGSKNRAAETSNRRSLSGNGKKKAKAANVRRKRKAVTVSSEQPKSQEPLSRKKKSRREVF